MASSALSPNVVKTALDKVFFMEFRPSARPDFGSVTDPMIFSQYGSDRAAEIVEELKSGGYWDPKAETQNVPAGVSRTGNQVTFTHSTFAKGEDIPKEFFDDDQHSVVQKMIREMALNGRQTREKNGMLTFVRAQTAAYTGGDGATLESDSHTLLDGTTQDNKLTAVLSTTSLDAAIVALAQQKSQAGVLMGIQPRTLLVPPALYKKAVEITESKLEAHTADNQLNVFSAKYGLAIKQTPFIGAAAGGSDTAWHLIGELNGLERYEREPISTQLREWGESRSDTYFYKARYRESTGWSSHIGIVGSDGSV